MTNFHMLGDILDPISKKKKEEKKGKRETKEHS